MGDFSPRCDVAIVGSSFAGSLLARILASRGRSVVLLERGTHPRFALGESSTPLASLSLERLAARYGMPDLHRLATHGRWIRTFPDLRRGRKRGFTFYHHRADLPYENDAENAARLLVAASPHDFASDTHWLRADVDHYFVRKALETGVRYLDRVELDGATPGEESIRLDGKSSGERFTLNAGFVVDSSGSGGFLSRFLDIPPRPLQTMSALVYGHFDRVQSFQDVALDAGIAMPPGPYPDERAAVHHLLDGGWMYALRFDHGVVSAGILFTGALLAATPNEVWRETLARYPMLERAFRDAAPQFPLGGRADIQHCMGQATGGRWAALPSTYAFVDPLFSTGIAWSLLGVERLAELLTGAPDAIEPGLARYGDLLSREANRIDTLVAGAYDAMREFRLFTSHAMIYFALVSHAEIRQRLAPPATAWGHAWEGFLGATDPRAEGLLTASADRLRAAAKAGEGIESYEAWVRDAIAPWNVAGLHDPSRRNLYPVDLDVLLDRASLLGMSRKEVEAALPHLRGDT